MSLDYVVVVSTDHTSSQFQVYMYNAHTKSGIHTKPRWFQINYAITVVQYRTSMANSTREMYM